jgi:hypothetical protein
VAGAGWVPVQLGWGIGELGCEGGNGLPVAFECLAFVVGEVECPSICSIPLLTSRSCPLVMFLGR